MTTYLDTRDLAKRKEELEELRDTVTTAEDDLDQIRTRKPGEDDSLAELEAWENERGDAELVLENAKNDFGTDEQDELEELETLENEISEWRHGETLIPESEFENYARQFADDIGAIDNNAHWPLDCIDWEKAARDLAMDYSLVIYQGTDYYVRA